MKAKAIKGLFCFVVTGLVVFWSASPLTGEDLKSLEDVHAIGISARVEGRTLMVNLFYESEDQSIPVFWTSGEVQCQCAVYQAGGSPVDLKRGARIAGSIGRLSGFDQDVAIELPGGPSGGAMFGVVECAVHTGTQELTASTDFLW